jgi:tetratricopeptide (TPR) repeat protein
VLLNQGKYEEAEAMNRRALDGREKVLGEEHPDTLKSFNNLASALQRQGKYEEAEAMIRRALDGCEKALGNDHPETTDERPLPCMFAPRTEAVRGCLRIIPESI